MLGLAVLCGALPASADQAEAFTWSWQALPLSLELTVLRQAQADLRAGLPASALRRLADYDRRFGRGALEEERQAVAAIARCQVDPGSAAEIQAARFLRSAPESPLAERVRSACQKSAEIVK